jgi:hypothetical protein
MRGLLVDVPRTTIRLDVGEVGDVNIIAPLAEAYLRQFLVLPDALAGGDRSPGPWPPSSSAMTGWEAVHEVAREIARSLALMLRERGSRR